MSAQHALGVEEEHQVVLDSVPVTVLFDQDVARVVLSQTIGKNARAIVFGTWLVQIEAYVIAMRNAVVQEIKQVLPAKGVVTQATSARQMITIETRSLSIAFLQFGVDPTRVDWRYSCAADRESRGHQSDDGHYDAAASCDEAK